MPCICSDMDLSLHIFFISENVLTKTVNILSVRG